MIGSQVMCWTWRVDGLPSKSVSLTPSGVITARSPSAEEEQVARVIQNRGHVGGDEVFVFAQPDDGGRAVARGDDLVGLVDRDHAEREHAGQFLHGFAHGFFKVGPVAVAGLQIVLLDQVGDDFGVGLGGELVAFFHELLFQGEIIFDDAVVNDDDRAGAIAMRMGVFFGGTAVSGPARVSDAVGAVERLERG